MKIKLKVLKGLGVGKEVKIPVPKCLIGRDDVCQLRPKSEAVSRKHCVIYVKEGSVYIRDLQSRNGTYVNGELIKADTTLNAGDEITIGPIVFEIQIDHSLGGEKKPKVNSIKEAAARTTKANAEGITLDDSNITDWLAEADLIERERRITDPETRQLKLDETDRVDLQKAIEQRAKEQLETEQAKKVEDAKETEEQKKKEPGKLPSRPENTTKDSREAAAKMLKKFFNNR